jgi:hypothetical protein
VAYESIEETYVFYVSLEVEYMGLVEELLCVDGEVDVEVQVQWKGEKRGMQWEERRPMRWRC